MLATIRQRIAAAIHPEGVKERRALERLINIDGLTGLGNRRAFELALPAAELDSNTAVIVFDMNNLGRANKIDGHREGDRLIRRGARTIQIVAKRVTKSARTFRIGGDEFVVICDKGSAAMVVSAVCRAFGVFTMSDGTHVSMSGTYGGTFADADSSLQLQKASDKEAIC